MYEYIYIYIYVCVCICIYICIYMYVCINLYIQNWWEFEVLVKIGPVVHNLMVDYTFYSLCFLLGKFF